LYGKLLDKSVEAYILALETINRLFMMAGGRRNKMAGRKSGTFAKKGK